MTQPLTDAINALTAYANSVTGASDETLSEAVGTLANGYSKETNSFKYDIGTFTFSADQKSNSSKVVSHNLKEIPDIIIIWTDDFNNWTEENPSPYTTTTMVGGVYLKNIVKIPQSLTSTQITTAAQMMWTVSANGYKMGYTFTSASYGFSGSITSTTFTAPYSSASVWWRTGVTYKYFVATKFW